MIQRRLIALAAGWVCLMAPGCGTWQTSEAITPTSYQVSREQVPRTVGKLRRMAVLQVEQAAPRACGAAEDAAAILLPVDLEVREELLARRKGYETVVPDAQSHAEWLMPPGSAAFVAEIMQWPMNVESFSAGPQTRALLERLRVNDRIDGLLILRVQYTCTNAFTPLRGINAIATLGLSEALPDPRMRELYKIYRIVVFETSSAGVVWQTGRSAMDLRLVEHLSLRDSKTAAPTDMERLFEDFEPAVPKILTR